MVTVPFTDTSNEAGRNRHEGRRDVEIPASHSYAVGYLDHAMSCRFVDPWFDVSVRATRTGPTVAPRYAHHKEET